MNFWKGLKHRPAIDMLIENKRKDVERARANYIKLRCELTALEERKKNSS